MNKTEKGIQNNIREEERVREKARDIVRNGSGVISHIAKSMEGLAKSLLQRCEQMEAELKELDIMEQDDND